MTNPTPKHEDEELGFNQSDFHELLMAYAVAAEKEGALSPRVVETRMNLSTHYFDLIAHSEQKALEARIDELDNVGYRAGGYDIQAKGGKLIDERQSELQAQLTNNQGGK